jgi:hypothetical protein
LIWELLLLGNKSWQRLHQAIILGSGKTLTILGILEAMAGSPARPRHPVEDVLLLGTTGLILPLEVTPACPCESLLQLQEYMGA